MKVAIVIIVVLLLCCCITVVSGLALFGNFALNGSCVWRGPLVEEGNAVTECKKVVPVDTDDSNDVDNDEDLSSNTLQYNGAYSDEFTFEYDSSLTLTDEYSDDILLKLGITNFEGTEDSINVVKTSYEEMDYFSCYEYGDTIYSSITGNNDSNFYSDVTSMDGYETCVIYYTFETASGIEIYQRQAVYPVIESSADYIVTQTYVVGSDNIELLNDTYNSFDIL